MSKRTGEFITMREVIDEVGAEAAKFYFLMRDSKTHLEYLELAKQRSSDNPVYYVQYAHARICSLWRVASERGIVRPSASDVDLTVLTDPDELGLIKKLAAYPEVLQASALAFEPHRVRIIFKQLAALLHTFYEIPVEGSVLVTTSKWWLVESGGARNVEVVIDDVKRVEELDELNNSPTLSFHAGETDSSDKPDLAVVDILMTPPLPVVGEPTSFEVSVKNIGGGNTPSTSLCLGVAVPFPVEIWSSVARLDPLAPDDLITVSIPVEWVPDFPGMFLVQAIGDCRGAALESNESNNGPTKAFASGGTTDAGVTRLRQPAA